MKRLEDFRVKTLPPEHPLHADERLWDMNDSELVERLNAAASRDRPECETCGDYLSAGYCESCTAQGR